MFSVYAFIPSWSSLRGSAVTTSSQITAHAVTRAPAMTSNLRQHANLEPLTWKIFFSPLFFTYSLGKNSFKLEGYEEMKSSH